MRASSLLLCAATLAAALGAAACQDAGGAGCGGPTEAELDELARSKIDSNSITCGPGTKQVGNVCERVDGPSTQTP